MVILKEKQVREILDSLDKEFDSHKFIFEFMRKFPQEYTEGLYEHRNKIDPFRFFHSQIAKFLKQQTDLVELIGEVTSANIRTYLTENKKWRKKY